MLKKRLGINAIERIKFISSYFKIPPTLTIPEGCVKVGLAAFCGCWWLEEVVIPKSVEWIENNAFEDCKKLRDVVIPEGVVEIGFYAFKGCQKLKEVVIPKSVEWIGHEAFQCCEITLEKPESKFKFISPNAFSGCKGVTYAKEKTRT